MKQSYNTKIQKNIKITSKKFIFCIDKRILSHYNPE